MSSTSSKDGGSRSCARKIPTSATTCRQVAWGAIEGCAARTMQGLKCVHDTGHATLSVETRRPGGTANRTWGSRWITRLVPRSRGVSQAMFAAKQRGHASARQKRAQATRCGASPPKDVLSSSAHLVGSLLQSTDRSKLLRRPQTSRHRPSGPLAPGPSLRRDRAGVFLRTTLSKQQSGVGRPSRRGPRTTRTSPAGLARGPPSARTQALSAPARCQRASYARLLPWTAPAP